MKTMSLRAMSVCILLLLSTTGGVAQGFLHASGIRIVDGSGNEVLLRGMGLGGWLVPEGYMIGTNSPYDSPSGFRTAVQSLVGTQGADQFFTAYRKYYVQRRDIDSLARWGFNSVRLPFPFGLLMSSGGVYLESGFAIIDSLLGWCEADRMYLILDMHCAPGGQNTINISDYQGPPCLWESATLQQWTAELWKEIARRYTSRQWIGGYDLLNETAYTFPNSNNKPLRDLFVRITDSIRTVDKNHIIYAEGNWYATDFSNLTPAWDANMAWSFHKYWNDNSDPGSIIGFMNLRTTTNVPLWMGESGENSNQWFADAIRMFEGRDIGWSWWTLKKTETIAAPLSARRSLNYTVLLNYWNSGGATPSAAFAQSALNEEASLLDIAQCTFHPDFIDALLRLPSTTARKPFAANLIPGVIYAPNYDMGQNGVAYNDVDFQNTGGSGGGTYNSGYAYRNDGVDIEKCPDGLSNGYDVGWTAAGEFLAYTVQVAAGGVYDIRVRVSSGSTGGTARLSWDGSDLSSGFSVPATGGWQTWTTLDLGDFPLSAGSHDLRMTMVTGGYNIERIEFVMITGASPEGHNMPRKFQLDQNYPNPFNPVTTIRYGLPFRSDVTLAMYDILGQQVSRLVDGEMEAGYHDVRFDGARLASGIYFYRLSAGDYVETRQMLLLR
jgi:endoglucanase